MTTFRFMHAADAHIGAGQVHGNETGQNPINSRLVDFRDAWVRLCRHAAEEKLDAFLFAGDGFKNSQPTTWEQEAFATGLRVLIDAGIPVIMCVGNHDENRNVSKPSALAIFDGYLGADVRVFDRPTVTKVGDVPIAVLPWVQRAHVAARNPDFERMSLDEQNQHIVDLSLAVLRSLGGQAEQQAGPLGSILLAHTAIGGATIGQAEDATKHFREPILPLSELRGLPHIYQAHGHFHRAQKLADGRQVIAYAGSPERIDFNETAEDKGAWIVALTAREPEVAWHSSNPRPFVDLDLEDPAAWETATAALNGNVNNAVVRVRYQATPEVARTIDHGGIRRTLYAAGAAKVHGPFAQIEHSVTRTENPVDEQTSPLAGWREWAKLQGIDGDDFARLDARVQEALEGVQA